MPKSTAEIKDLERGVTTGDRDVCVTWRDDDT